MTESFRSTGARFGVETTVAPTASPFPGGRPGRPELTVVPQDSRQPSGPREQGLDPSRSGLEDEVAHLAFLALAAHRLATEKRTRTDAQRAPGFEDRLAALDRAVDAVQARLRRLAE